MTVRAYWKVGNEFPDEILVLDATGTGVTGLVAANFTFTLTVLATPGTTPVSSAQPVTITEIGGGLYVVKFTPNTYGQWYLRVDNTSYGTWHSTVVVRNRDIDDLAYSGMFNLSPSGMVQADIEEWGGEAVNPLIFGRPDVSVGDMQSGVITSTSYASGASSSGLTASQVSAAVWDELRASHVVAGSFGERVLADVQRWLTSTPNALQSGRVDSYLGATATGVISSSTFAANALGAVWDEPRSSHVTAGTFGEIGVPIIRTGTCQAGSTGTTIVLDSGASASNDFYTFMLVTIKSGTAAGCSQFISSYNGTTKTATVSPGWNITPDATSVFVIFSTSIQGIDWNVIANQGVSKSLSNTSIGSVINSVGSVTGNVGGNVTGSVGSVTGNVGGNVVGSVGSVTGNVGGNVTGSVGSLGATAKTDVENSVWNASQASHVGAGSFGLYLDTTVSSRLATSGYTAPLSAAATANAVWNEAFAGHATAGTFGLQLGSFSFNGNYPLVDLRLWNGSAPVNLSTGYVQVDVEKWLGTGTPNALIAGRVDANAQVVGDKTGYALTAGERSSIATAVWNLANAIDGSITPEKALTYVFATTAGVSAGEPAGANDTFAGPSGVTRVTTTYDANNNRSTVTLG